MLHLHYRLLARGMTPRSITLSLVALSFLLGVAAVLLSTSQKIVFFGLVALLLGAVSTMLAHGSVNRRMVYSITVMGVFLLVGVALFTLWPREGCRDFGQGTVRVGDREIHVSVAQTEVERSRGLSGCAALPKRSGMYFPYDQNVGTVSFWMRGMEIPLDIVWVLGGEVIGVEERAPVPADPWSDEFPRYSSPGPVDGVLEIGAGQAAALGIQPGTKVQASFNN